MNGHVDSAGRALVRIGVKPSATATAVEIDAWVDTGFTGVRHTTPYDFELQD